MDKNRLWYAPTEDDKNFDKIIRDKIRENGSSADMALCIQNQRILSLLREVNDNLNEVHIMLVELSRK